MKLKDFLRKKAEDASIRDTDLEALLGASQIADVEVPDTFVTKFNESYMTRSRAENDPDIVLKIQNKSKAEVYDRVDSLLEDYYNILDPEVAKEFGKDKFPKIYERIEKLGEAIKSKIKSAGTKLSDDVQKVENEWSGKYKALEKKTKEETERIINTHRDENLNFALKTKLLGYKFADAFGGLKDTIIRNVISDVKAERHNGNPIVLERDDSGEIHVKQNVDGTLRDVYVKDNDKLTIDKLLDQKMDTFIVKSNGSGNENGGGGKNQAKPIIDTSKMTLAEINASRLVNN